MKYGYLLYQKPLISDMPDRPINLGDPIQSYAVKLLYKEMGISDNDIIPVPRYDLSNYNGEECICVINTCSTYEELAYDSHFMPPSKKIHAIPFSLHINREMSESEVNFYRSCDDVGCRDIFTQKKLEEYGINAYLTGCLSLTFPRRSLELENNADKTYFIDVQKDFLSIIPSKIKENAIELSSIERFKITNETNRMTIDEALKFHKLGEARVELLKNTARLVITSRLHVAAPCLAMGIPVILTRHDDRFGFIDCLLKPYTDWKTDVIDWNPKPVDIEETKEKIKEMFFCRVKATVKKLELEDIWRRNGINEDIVYEPEVKRDLMNAKFPKNRYFRYAVLGVISSTSFFIPDFMKELYPESELVYGIDSYVEKDFFGKKVIKPFEIDKIDSDIIIITAIKGAYESAKQYLSNRPHVIIKGKTIKCINF